MAEFITSEKTPRKSGKDARFPAPLPHHNTHNITFFAPAALAKSSSVTSR
jgi:hypothetical protein